MVKGISVRPVCLPAADHSVSPCLMRYTRGSITSPSNAMIHENTLRREDAEP
jgi:hypothetical protein